MFDAEEAWFAAQLNALQAEEVSPCCNIGSGAGDGPPRLRRLLEARGVKMLNVDQKEGRGVDISADIFSAEGIRQVRELRPRLLICMNMIEHVPRCRVVELARFFDDCLSEGGYLFISAPKSHPYHLDPIDTMYRTGPSELAQLFPGMTVLGQAVVHGPTYWEELRQMSWSDHWRVARRLLKPFRKRERWKAAAHRFFWLWRPYEETCLVLQKPFGPLPQRS